MRSVLDAAERSGLRGITRAEALRIARDAESIERLVRFGLILPCYCHGGTDSGPPELVYHAIPRR